MKGFLRGLPVWMAYLKICLMAILPMLVSCRATHKIPTKETQHDSVRVEVRTETVYIPDTVYIEIPAQVAERTTRDSTSHLENDYATSEARINTDGTLYHDLKTKQQEKPVPIKIPSERKDSIVYVDKEVKVPVMVEKELTRWQQVKVSYGGWAMGIIFVFILIVVGWMVYKLKK